MNMEIKDTVLVQLDKRKKYDKEILSDFKQIFKDERRKRNFISTVMTYFYMRSPLLGYFGSEYAFTDQSTWNIGTPLFLYYYGLFNSVNLVSLNNIKRLSFIDYASKFSIDQVKWAKRQVMDIINGVDDLDAMDSYDLLERSTILDKGYSLKYDKNKVNILDVWGFKKDFTNYAVYLNLLKYSTINVAYFQPLNEDVLRSDFKDTLNGKGFTAKLLHIANFDKFSIIILYDENMKIEKDLLVDHPVSIQEAEGILKNPANAVVLNRADSFDTFRHNTLRCILENAMKVYKNNDIDSAIIVGHALSELYTEEIFWEMQNSIKDSSKITSLINKLEELERYGIKTLFYHPEQWKQMERVLYKMYDSKFRGKKRQFNLALKEFNEFKKAYKPDYSRNEIDL